MDTISRENNSYLPVAGVIVGVLALVLSGVALAKISSAKKELAEQFTTQVEPLGQRISDAEAKAGAAASSSDNAARSINKLATDTQAAFQTVAQELGNIRGEITKVQDAKVTKAPGKDGKNAGPVVAGPDEYIVKAGDGGAKIARAHNVTIAELSAVNPGVEWTKLKVGQKLKLPAKR